MTYASACCLSAIAGKEIFCAASEMAWITPVSCTGKKSLGHEDIEHHGQDKGRQCDEECGLWRLRTHCSVRP